MKIKTLAIALAFTATPMLAYAEGCSHSKQKQAMSCATGTVYDDASNTCLPVNT